jgi:mevalonate kinase
MTTTSFTASAPAKLILLGEHAVVYGRAAIALPLADVRAYAHIEQGTLGSGLSINTPDMGGTWLAADIPDHPLSALVQSTLRYLDMPSDPSPDLTISIRSDIPIAGGLGSGAAVATAVVRALARHMGHMPPTNDISSLVYHSEQRYHGTPSGIDNTVVAYEQPIWFERQATVETPEPHAVTELYNRLASSTQDAGPLIEPVDIAAPLSLVIGDTGVRSETRLPVGEVRRRWEAAREEYEFLFNRIDYIVRQGRIALASGDETSLGLLMNDNQEVLEQIGVSSPELEKLNDAALSAGAFGAKLSGGGWGGVMVAITYEENSPAVAEALRRAGAVQVRETQVRQTL